MMVRVLAFLCRICPFCICARQWPESGFAKVLARIEKLCPACIAYARSQRSVVRLTRTYHPVDPVNPVEKMNIKILHDNQAKKNFQCGWGFSALVDNSTLFDTGENAGINQDS